MRVITIDNGNSNPHAGIFIDGHLNEVIALTELILQPNDITIVSSVGRPLSFETTYSINSLRQQSDHLEFLSMPVHYSQTLGDDRLVLAHYAYSQIKNSHEKVLIVDAGTFLTADLTSHEGFLGGHIFLGLKTYLASYKQGAQLPVVAPPKEFNILSTPPRDTESAIMGACQIYIEAILEKLIKKNSPSKVILTGGSCDIIYNLLMQTNLGLPIEKDPHLIHLAMFSIVQAHLDQ